MESFTNRTDTVKPVSRPSPSIQGRSDGPLRAHCEVLAYRKTGSFHSLTLVSPEIADRAKPGQFITLGVEASTTILRRPFWIYQVSRHGPWAGTIEIVFDVVGEGTRWLASRNKHDMIDVVGPLGTPFPLPSQEVTALLVGSGYGAAPLLYLATTLSQRGSRADMLIGASTSERLFNAIEAKRVSATTIFATEDGSVGETGRATDLLEGILEKKRTDLVYAAGSMAMLRDVSAICVERNVPVRVATEEAMACGTGVCQTCVLPVERQGRIVHLRGCVEGPVFNGAKVCWDAIGALPVMAAQERDDTDEGLE